MIENQELLKQLQQLLKWKKSRSFMADRLQVTELELDRLLVELRSGYPLGDKKEDEESGGYERTGNVDKGTFKSTLTLDYEPKTIDELYKLHSIDKSLYKISTYYSKLKSTGKFTSTVFCTLKKPNEFSLEEFAKFIKGYVPTGVEVNIGNKIKTSNELVDVEISIADFHLDRLTLQSDNIAARKEEYLTVLRNLVKSTFSIYDIDRFIFIIGNDFFNTDNYQGLTTNLTVQENSVTWNRAYEEGFDLLVKAISILATFAKNVEVILVQGNHARTKEYYLAHALSVHFAESPTIKFDRANSNTKFTVAGSTFLGYHHGNTKIDELPLLFATNQNSAKHFGNSSFREVHTGDKHFYMAKEIKGVRVQQIPSMVNPDRWSNDGLYVNNVRAGLAFVYHPTKGRICEFEERI